MKGLHRLGRRPRAVVIGLSAAAAVAGVVTLLPSSAGATTLGTQAAPSGRYFGTAVAAGRLGDSTYTTILDREFNMITPENEMKWDATEPYRGSFNFGPADQIVNHATSHGQQLRGHTLVWHSQLPDWVKGITDAATLRSVMNNHITTQMTHYKGKIHSWDVVNEAFADGTTASTAARCSRTCWATGSSRRRSAPPGRPTPRPSSATTTTTSRTGPTPRLRACTRWCATSSPVAYPSTVSGSRATSAPAGRRPTSGTTLSSFAALGVDVQITELDIATAPPTAYANTVKACLDVSRCTGITVWGIRDSDSWLSADTPLLFDSGGNPKPAYNTVLSTLSAGTSPPTNPPTNPPTSPPSSPPTSPSTSPSSTDQPRVKPRRVHPKASGTVTSSSASFSPSATGSLL